MHWYQWFEKADTYTAIPLQLGGFWIAIWQIRKTRSSVESARRAAVFTQDSIARNNLLLQIPQLQRLEQQLQFAIKSNMADLAVNHLDSWRYHASMLRGLLEQVSNETDELLQVVQNSVSLASIASRGAQKPGADLAKVTRPVREAIMRVTDEATAIASGLAGRGVGNE